MYFYAFKYNSLCWKHGLSRLFSHILPTGFLFLYLRKLNSIRLGSVSRQLVATFLPMSSFSDNFRIFPSIVPGFQCIIFGTYVNSQCDLLSSCREQTSSIFFTVINPSPQTMLTVSNHIIIRSVHLKALLHDLYCRQSWHHIAIHVYEELNFKRR